MLCACPHARIKICIGYVMHEVIMGARWHRDKSAPTTADRWGVQLPKRIKICLEIAAPPDSDNQLSYDEHTDRALSVGRWRRLQSYYEAKKMKSAAFHTHACLGFCLKGLLFFFYEMHEIGRA